MESKPKKSHPVIKNIFYMLSYVYDILNQKALRRVGTESFDNILDLATALLIQALKNLLKQGLPRDYKREDGALISPRGKINITESIRRNSFLKKELYCSYDEFSPDNEMNRIIKSTLLLLLKTNIDSPEKKEIKRLLLYFDGISTINLSKVNWNVKISRNKTVEFILFVCMLISEGLIQNEDGNLKTLNFIAEPIMARLYEKFLLAYFRKEFPNLTVNASQIPWQIGKGIDSLLPVMQSDVMISDEDNVLILDAKYYSSTLQTYYGVSKIHSGNLYQIFTYVKNKEAELKDSNIKVSGMLLYARTNEEIQPDSHYIMDGNRISIETLDLNQEFGKIREKLNSIIERHFKDNLK